MMEFQKYESLHFALERINLLCSSLCEVQFLFKSSFSCVDFELAAHNDGVRKFVLSFNTLFKVGVKPEYSEALKFIHRSRNHPWPPFHANPNLKQSEKKCDAQCKLRNSSASL